MSPRMKKRPDEMTTDELLRHVFPKRVADALESAVTDADDPTPDAPKPHTNRPTKEP